MNYNIEVHYYTRKIESETDKEGVINSVYRSKKKVPTFRIVNFFPIMYLFKFLLIFVNYLKTNKLIIYTTRFNG